MAADDEEDAGERAEAERYALRDEIFAGFMEYLFADGPEPSAVRARIAGIMGDLSETVAVRMHGPETWADAAVVAAVLRRHHGRLIHAEGRSRARLSVWLGDLARERDQEVVTGTLARLLALLVCEGCTWRAAVAQAFALAKALRPQLIGGMPLSDMARLCGDAGRATPCARVKRLYNARLAASGAKGTQAPYQKSAGAAAQYAAAQAGNSNRSKRYQTLSARIRRKK
jgi:hypothetical protein